MSLTKVTPSMIEGSKNNQFTFPMIQGTPISVLDYDADPTGVLDSTAAIQNAIDAGLLANKPVFIPAGTYKITSVITLSASATPYLNGVRVFGAGMYQTVLNCQGTAFLQSNQTQVNDSIYVSDLTIKKDTSTAVIGVDIGTIRNSIFSNVQSLGFQVGFSISANKEVANWWNRFYNCQASCGNIVGSAGFVLGNNDSGTTIKDLDYNDFYGCKSFSAEVGIVIFYAISCVISGHQVTACTTVLQIYKGNNNRIQVNGEAVTNMGFAQGPTLGNQLDLYNDGRLAVDFIDNGFNHIFNQILDQPTLPNTLRTLDCFVQDRVSFSMSGVASKNIFQISFSAPEASFTVTVTTAMLTYITGTSCSVQVWDITIAGGIVTVTPVRANSSGTMSDPITATVGSGNVIFSAEPVSGDTTHITIGQSVVSIQGCGALEAYPYMEAVGYARI